MVIWNIISDDLVFSMFEEIQTQRLTLRALENRDARKIFEYRSSPDVSRFQSWGTDSPCSIELYILGSAAVEAGTPGPRYQIGMTLLTTELIRNCGFCVLESEPHQAEIGIALALEFQKQGYATEALRTLLHYSFVKLAKHRVFGSVDPNNLSSVNLLQRVGMQQEAHFVKSL